MRVRDDGDDVVEAIVVDPFSSGLLLQHCFVISANNVRCAGRRQ